MSADEQVPEGIDVSVATIARIYDYFLGGHNNFAADRIAALKLAERSPEVPLAARANRAFLQRAVRYLAGEAGIRQFLDLGTGLPTTGNVHQVAHSIAPEARVVYVDKDPMVLAHSRALKTGDRTAVIQADLRDTGTILSHPDTQRLIDFTQPLAVLFVAVLHYVPDPDAEQAVARFISVTAPGSYLAISHVIKEADPTATETITTGMAKTASPTTLRTRQEVLRFFDGTDLLEPGLAPLHRWRPDGSSPADEGTDWLVGGIGRLQPDHARVAVPAMRAAGGSAPPGTPAAAVAAEPAPGPVAVLEQAPAAVREQAPAIQIDTSVASAARIYDYWLGGHNNFAADRRAAHEFSELMPEVQALARENRAFLQRAVRFLAGEAGIRQFLDLGTGLPTRGNVHEAAQSLAPGARVISVDNDPMVLVHSRALKTGENTAVLQADLRDADTILSHPETRRLIDFTQPLAVLFVAVLHFIVDDAEASSAVSRYLSAAAPGSHLALSHANCEPDPDVAAAGSSVYARTAYPAAGRTPAQIRGFFGGLEMVEPGVVPIWQWRPDGHEPPAELREPWGLGGVGRKPA